jgi:hypothetical protein
MNGRPQLQNNFLVEVAGEGKKHSNYFETEAEKVSQTMKHFKTLTQYKLLLFFFLLLNNSIRRKKKEKTFII